MEMERVIYSVLFFILFVTLLYVSKHSILFLPSGNLRAFGIKQDETLFSFGTICVVVSFTCVFAFTLLEIMCL